MFIDRRCVPVTKAPEGRHVYRIRDTPNNQSPRGATCDSGIREETLTQRRNDAKNAAEGKRRKGTLEPVGVGLPNPSGEETSPLRWVPCLEIALHLAPAGRHVDTMRKW